MLEIGYTMVQPYSSIFLYIYKNMGIIEFSIYWPLDRGGAGEKSERWDFVSINPIEIVNVDRLVSSA